MDEEFEFYFNLLDTEDTPSPKKINGYYRCRKDNCKNIIYEFDTFCWRHSGIKLRFKSYKKGYRCIINDCYNRVMYHPDPDKMKCYLHSKCDTTTNILQKRCGGLCNFKGCESFANYGYDKPLMRRLTCIKHKLPDMTTYTQRRKLNFKRQK